MSNVFGGKPDKPKPLPLPSPKPSAVRTTEVSKDVRAQLARKRKSMLMARMSQEPAVLRRQLGGGTV